jgi:bifunctional DNA-binding transcriptional regulator/antitoxin component of YhaV-PrlF toxin-antitoxin module
MEVLCLKIQKSVSHTRGNREYVKHQIVIPNRIIDQLEWSQGDCIEATIRSKGLLLRKIRQESKLEELDYEQFKEAVLKVLQSLPEGCAWSKLRQLATLYQKTPSPLWVKKLEDENILLRTKDQTTSQLIWSLREPTQIHQSLNGWITKDQK